MLDNEVILLSTESDTSTSKVFDSKTNKWLSPKTTLHGSFTNLENIGKFKFAILDTGLVSEHPTIKPILKESINFSNESGIEDNNGHGTMVCLKMLGLSPIEGIEVYNVKILNSLGRGSKQSLVKGIEWCIENKMNLIRISAGTFSVNCESNCEVCVIAKKAADNGIPIMAASGNSGFSKVYCPAKAGILGHMGILAIGARSLTGMPKSFSGKANVYAEDYTPISSLTSLYLSQGNEFLGKSQFEKAISFYDKALKLDSEFTEAWNNKGLALYKQTLMESAIECYDKALELDPNFSDAWNNKGNCLQKMGFTDKASSCFRKIKDRSIAKRWLEDGHRLFESGHFNEAVYYYGISLIIEPSNYLALHNLAEELLKNALKNNVNITEKCNISEKCNILFDKILETKPTCYSAWINKGTALSILGRDIEGKKCTNKGLDLMNTQV